MRISDWSSDVCSSDLVKPMHPDTILENPDFFEGATIVVPHFIGSDNEIPIPVFARLKIEGESVVYEGVCPDGETLVAGQLSQDDLARISIWKDRKSTRLNSSH